VVIGVSPRHVAAVGGGVAAAWLLLALFGPMLSLPSWLVSLSPYDHLGQVPLTGWDLPGTLAVSGLGLLAGALGWLAYRRRDLL
jgi:ABC-2 type transport system permease protein